LTTYPWFCLARVVVYPYRIQPGVVLPAPAEVASVPESARRKRLSPQAALLFPQFGRTMPLLKEMLIAARTSSARAQ